MATLREIADKYQPQTVKNIADLEVVDISLPVEERAGTDKTGQPYSFYVLIANAQEYRLPETVITQIKAIRLKNPNITKFNVAKSGQGMSTRYQVVPIM